MSDERDNPYMRPQGPHKRIAYGSPDDELIGASADPAAEVSAGTSAEIIDADDPQPDGPSLMRSVKETIGRNKPLAGAGVAIVAMLGGILLLNAVSSKPSSNPAASGSGAPQSGSASATTSGAPGTAQPFRATGSLGEARTGHTANTLADGRIFVTGGCDGDGHGIATAEVYDPAIGKFIPVGSMTAARCHHTSTALKDGRFLIAGGVDGTGATLTSAEIFDPKKGTFAPTTGFMVGMRAYHTATLLPSGQVLVAGGRARTGEETATAELFNPATGKFSLTGSLVKARAGAAAILLQDTRVLIVGGVSTDNAAGGEVYEATAELYDTKKLAFTKSVSLVTGRYLQVLYRVPTTWQVLVIGGWAGADSTVGTLESFDPKTNTFTESGNLIQARAGMTVTAVPDGRLLIMGGWTRVGVATSSVEICDPKTHTCKPLARMPEGRADHTASLLSDGAVVLIGGSVVSDGKVKPTDSVRLLLPLILQPAN